MSFERARAIADAVLLEGYVLYPYRASSAKNRYRWAFGILAPRTWSEGPVGCESWWMETQCLVEPGPSATLNGRLRFLQMRRRTVEEAFQDGFRQVQSLEVDGDLHLPWDEGDIREIPLGPIALGDAPAEELCVPFEVPGDVETMELGGPSGRVVGRVRRSRWDVHGVMRVRVERVDAARPLVRLRVRVENASPWEDVEARRDDALRKACLSSHLLLSVSGGAFVSLLDPPEWAREAAAACTNVRTYPVLAGPEGSRDLVLSAPIILYDHPQVAPESPGDFFDATEIDALLTLRSSTLTEGEKREVRATDPRGAAILDRVEDMPPEMMERLHGAIRELEVISPQPPPSPAHAFAPGMRVRLRPGHRRTDAQDLLFAGRVATVEKVMEDVDGQHWLAVTLDDDPAADLHRWYGRFHYYYVDEVEVLAPGEGDQV